MEAGERLRSGTDVTRILRTKAWTLAAPTGEAQAPVHYILLKETSPARGRFIQCALPWAQAQTVDRHDP